MWMDLAFTVLALLPLLPVRRFRWAKAAAVCSRIR